MRYISEEMRARVEDGRPLVGADAFHLRVTVEPGWWLHDSSPDDAERADVMRRAVAAWRAEAPSGLGVGRLSDTSPNGIHLRLGADVTPDAADPRYLPRRTGSYIHVPGGAGNFVATAGSVNLYGSNEAATPFGDGLVAIGDAQVSFDPVGVPVDEIPDTAEDAYGDPDDFDPDPDANPGDGEPLPEGDGASVVVPAGAVDGGRGVTGPADPFRRAHVLPGEDYTASASVRVPVGVAYRIEFVSYDTAGIGTAPTADDRVGTGDWERVALTATMPPDASTASIAVVVTDGTATTFNVARLQIEAGDEASDWAPSSVTRITTEAAELADVTTLSPTRVRAGGQTWTVHRATTGWKTAIVERPMFLLGTDDYFEADHHPLLNFGAGDAFTAVMAFRFHHLPAHDQFLMAKTNGMRGWELHLTPAGTARFVIYDAAYRTEVESDPLPLGVDLFLAGRRDASTASVFVNGANHDTAPLAGVPSTATEVGLRIGASPLGGGHADIEFVGAAVFAEALTSPHLARARDFLLAAPTLRPADVSKMPYRWWQRADNSQVEIEVPGVTSVNYDHAVDADVSTCSITIANQVPDPPGEDLVEGVFGDPGHYTPGRANPESASRWGMTPNEWADVFAANACIRIYWGYGGHDKPIRQAVADGDLLLKGVWLVDDVTPGARDNTLTLACRDMFKLCVDQEIYPGLIPEQQYPLERCRWRWEYSASPYDDTYSWPDPVYTGADGWLKRVADFTMAGSPEHPHGTGRGYWILGNDGKVFQYGWVNHHGDMGKGGLFSPAWSIASTPTAGGYWILTQKGHIFTFGDAIHYGEIAAKRDKSPSQLQWRRIRPTKSGKGYYLLERGGRVATFGDAVDYGDVRRILGQPVPWSHDYHTDLALTPTGRGYWILNKRGRVYAFGDAVGLVPGEQHFTTNDIRWSSFLAVDLGDRYNADSRYGEWCRAMTAHPTERGCWVLTTDAKMHAFGAARIFEPQEDVRRTNPVMALAPSQTGLGYMHLTADGDIDTYGDAAFYGSLRRSRQQSKRLDNDTPQGYRDLTEIVRDLLLWAGFYLHGSAGEVYGNLEATGTYNDECFNAPFFDKRSVLDVITEIRQIVGYFAWCDEEGAARFESPNFFVFGNFFPDGGRTTDIAVIAEKANLLNWSPTVRGDNLRSELIVASAEPTANLEGTVVSRFVPPQAAGLKGIRRVASWHNGLLTNPAEQELMAELVGMQWLFKQHTGTVGLVPHPAIEVNDQVWVYERSTGEARVHYVRGISFAWSANGAPTMTLTTNRLGSPDNWLVDISGWKNLPGIAAHAEGRDFENPDTTGVKL